MPLPEQNPFHPEEVAVSAGGERQLRDSHTHEERSGRPQTLSVLEGVVQQPPSMGSQPLSNYAAKMTPVSPLSSQAAQSLAQKAEEHHFWATNGHLKCPGHSGLSRATPWKCMLVPHSLGQDPCQQPGRDKENE